MYVPGPGVPSGFRVADRPTRPTSALYGRAQPLGQPVIRTVNRSSPSPCLSSSDSIWSINEGKARSASVTARPQVGSAGQAIDSVERC